jgi:hypothetical protein
MDNSVADKKKQQSHTKKEYKRPTLLWDTNRNNGKAPTT